MTDKTNDKLVQVLSKIMACFAVVVGALFVWVVIGLIVIAIGG